MFLYIGGVKGAPGGWLLSRVRLDFHTSVSTVVLLRVFLMVREQKSSLILPDPACWPGVHSRTRGGSPCEMCTNRFVKVARVPAPWRVQTPPFTLSLPSSLPVSRKSAPRHQLSPWTDGCCSCLLLPPPLSSLSDSIPRPAASSPLPHATSTCPHLALLLPLDHCSRTRSAPATLPSSLPPPPSKRATRQTIPRLVLPPFRPAAFPFSPPPSTFHNVCHRRPVRECLHGQAR